MSLQGRLPFARDAPWPAGHFFGNGSLAVLVQGVPQLQERSARRILHDDVGNDALFLWTLVNGVNFGNRYRWALATKSMLWTSMAPT